MKIKSVFKILQFQNKWVRTMLMVSILLVVGLSIYPVKELSQVQMYEEMPMREMQRMEIYDSTAIEIHVPKPKPIQVEILEKEKPFDWQGMISWVIGAVNGVVLLVMNIKNIRKK